MNFISIPGALIFNPAASHEKVLWIAARKFGSQVCLTKAHSSGINSVMPLFNISSILRAFLFLVLVTGQTFADPQKRNLLSFSLLAPTQNFLSSSDTSWRDSFQFPYLKKFLNLTGEDALKLPDTLRTLLRLYDEIESSRIKRVSGGTDRLLRHLQEARERLGRLYPNLNTNRPIFMFRSEDLRDGLFQDPSVSKEFDLDTAKAIIDFMVYNGSIRISVGFSNTERFDFNFELVRYAQEQGYLDAGVKVDLIARSLDADLDPAITIKNRLNLKTDQLRIMLFNPINEIRIHRGAAAQKAQVGAAIEKIVSNGLGVLYGVEDGTRTEMAGLLEMYRMAYDKGARVFFIADTVGDVAHDEDVRELVEAIRKIIGDSELGWHGHNDGSRSEANAIAALSSGADYVDTTLFRTGERAGNIDAGILLLQFSTRLPLRKAILGPDFHYGLWIPFGEALIRKLHIDVHPKHPFWGADITTHIAGIHASAILKGMTHEDPLQQVLSELVYSAGLFTLWGKAASTKISTASGAANIRLLLLRHGISLEKPEDYKSLYDWAQAQLKTLREADGTRFLPDETTLRGIRVLNLVHTSS